MMANFTAHEQVGQPAGTQLYRLQQDDQTLSFRDVINFWRTNPEFAAFFAQLLAASPYRDFRWETPPLTIASLGQPFEFALHDSPGLAPFPQKAAFAPQFAAQPGNEPAIAFSNLGGDAILVVPRPLANDATYRHLASFCRGAPAEQQIALWQLVGEQMAERVGDRPVWLSTAGGGVAWLHVRLDDRPKYYRHGPYRQLPHRP